MIRVLVSGAVTGPTFRRSFGYRTASLGRFRLRFGTTTVGFVGVVVLGCPAGVIRHLDFWGLGRSPKKFWFFPKIEVLDFMKRYEIRAIHLNAVIA
jgi:hypothetical protein